MPYNLNEPISGAPNFTLAELARSTTAASRGIDNTPSDAQAANLIYLAQHVLQPIREHFGVPIHVSSGFRSVALNRVIGGSSSSFHSHGMAADIEFLHPEDGNLIDMFAFIHDNLQFTELIAEEMPDGWIHVALAKGRESERQVKYKRIEGSIQRASYHEIINMFG